MSAAAKAQADQLAELLGLWRYTWLDEHGLHMQLANVLLDAEYAVRSEVPLGGRLGRIDLVVERTGIEVKVKGTAEEVVRQLQRYAHSDALDALVLATTRYAHTDVPDEIGGKPVAVAYLAKPC